MDEQLQQHLERLREQDDVRRLPPSELTPEMIEAWQRAQGKATAG
jgi:hypothetical protein